MIFLVLKYYNLCKHLNYTDSDFELNLPKRTPRRSLAILSGLKINAFQNLNNAEIIIALCKSWMSCGQLIASLYSIAQRARLAVIYPSISVDYPLKARSPIKFLLDAEKIQQWSITSRDSIKRWGVPYTLEDQEVMHKKTVEDRRNSTPFMKNVLVASYRVFRIDALLPELLYDAFNVDRIISSELRTIANMGTFYDGSLNEVLTKTAFPGLHMKQIRHSVKDLENENY